MLPARNFKSSAFRSAGLSAVFLISAAMLLFSGCKSDPTDEPDSIIGTVSSPAWTAPEDAELSSMTAVVKVDLYRTYASQLKAVADYQLSADDQLAAFCGEQCLGVTGLTDGLFYLHIAPPQDTQSLITLRFYSAALRNLFEATPITFAGDGILGTVDSPYTPDFTLSSNR